MEQPATTRNSPAPVYGVKDLVFFGELVAHWYKKFKDIPAEVHILCPKISDSDALDYGAVEQQPGSAAQEAEGTAQRISEGQQRIEITFWTSLLFSADETQFSAELGDFAARLESSLGCCDKCVIAWHTNRPAYREKFFAVFDHNDVAEIHRAVVAYDYSRIDERLQLAERAIKSATDQGQQFKKASLGDRLGEVLLAIYESLCLDEYLEVPDRDQRFQTVFSALQRRKPLQLGTKTLLPTMTRFLFDPDPVRRTFAELAWEQIEESSVTLAQFEWAIRRQLKIAIQQATALKKVPTRNEFPIEEEFLTTADYTRLVRFWTGFGRILRAASPNVIICHMLDLAAKTGTVYELAWLHLGLDSESVVLEVLSILSTLMEKAPQAFWTVMGNTRPSLLSDKILFHAPALLRLLNQGWDLPLSPDGVPTVMAWVKPFVRSILLDRQCTEGLTLSETLLRVVAINPDLNGAGRGVCLRGATEALAATLGSLQGGPPNMKRVRDVIQLLSEYGCALFDQARAEGEGRSGARNDESAVIEAVALALQVHAEATRAEYASLCGGAINGEETAKEEAANLWGLVAYSLHSYLGPAEGHSDTPSPAASETRVKIGKLILEAVRPYCQVEPFRPPEAGLNKHQARFNNQLKAATRSVARLINALAQNLTSEELTALLRPARLLEAVIVLAHHHDKAVSESAMAMIKGITGKDARVDAIGVLLQTRLCDTVEGLAGAIAFVLAPPRPWLPARPVLAIGRDTLAGLCDPAHGELRSRILRTSEIASVSKWWASLWKGLEEMFANSEPWSVSNDRRMMKNFCRDSMELADRLLSEVGAFASAFERSELADRLLSEVGAFASAFERSGKTSGDTTQAILAAPQAHSGGVVRMLRLTDPYLVETAVRVLVKLLDGVSKAAHGGRMAPSVRQDILDTCRYSPAVGRYKIRSNLTDDQRVEILHALGEDITDMPLPTGGVGVGMDSGPPSAVSTSVETPPSMSGPRTEASGPRIGASGPAPPSSTMFTNSSSAIAVGRGAIAVGRGPRTQPRAGAGGTAGAQPKGFLESRQISREEKSKADAKFKAQYLGQISIRDNPVACFLRDNSGRPWDEERAREFFLRHGAHDLDAEVAAAEARHLRSVAHVAPVAPQADGPVRKVRGLRTVRDVRARLNPSLATLHRDVLAWNVFAANQDHPPGMPAQDNIPSGVLDAGMYRKTFYPLLLSEAWHSFLADKAEATAQPYSLKVISRLKVDDFIEITGVISGAANPQQLLQNNFEGDIILLSDGESPLLDQDARSCLGRVSRVLKKRDEGDRGNPGSSSGYVEAKYRIGSHAGNRLAAALRPGIEVKAVKITNMVTIEREYAALESLPYYDLCEEVLAARASPMLKLGDAYPKKVKETWGLNDSQANAVHCAVENDGFTLIQGPPGTGKTNTIVAIVGALMSGPVKKEATTSSRPKKLLVCAPSNAAVDELVLRMMRGVMTSTGFCQIKVVRLGRSDALDAAVRTVSLDVLVEALLQGDRSADENRKDTEDVHSDAAKVKTQLAEKRALYEQTSRAGTDPSKLAEVGSEIARLKRRQAEIGAKIDSLRDERNTAQRDGDLRRRAAQIAVLNDADVLFSTLSGAGRDTFQHLAVDFETVIIDEAAQCVELSALIPMRYGCLKCILVGDPKQLPPTVLSRPAAELGYAQSLFVRIQRQCPKNVHLLNTQYRMHPEISAFPAAQFYNGALTDGPALATDRRAAWHADQLLKPYWFFDVAGSQERGGRGGRSLANSSEARAAVVIYERLIRLRGPDSEGMPVTMVGVITPYKAQLVELKKVFAQRGHDIDGSGGLKLEFNTTDAFQGRECDVIIFSCVRANKTGGIGFLNDARRMNVALTRGRSSLWVLGDSDALAQDPTWARLVENAKSRGLFSNKGELLVSNPSGQKRAGDEVEGTADKRGRYGDSRAA